MKFRKIMGATIFSAILLSSCNLGSTPAPIEDVGAVQTQAFNIIMTQAALQLTQTAIANPPVLPSNTPLPTATLGNPTFAPIGGGEATPFTPSTLIPGLTPLAAASAVPTLGVVGTVTTKNGCNDGTYLSDNGPKDWDVLTAGTAYSVTFSIQNVGTCVWDDGYEFVLLAKDSSPEIVWDNVSVAITKKEEFTEPQTSQAFTIKFTAPKTPGKYEAYWKLHDEAKNYFGPQVWIKFVIK